MNARSIPERQPEVRERLADRAIFLETAGGGNDRRPESDYAPFSPHAPREIQILEQIVISKTAEPFEHFAPDEHRLVAQKPAGYPRTHFR